MVFLRCGGEKNPRMLCGCQPVAFMISASVAPEARLISSKIFAVLLPGRTADALSAPFFGRTLA